MQSKRECLVVDCADAVVARGWCNRHYLRWRNHGDPLGGGPSPKVTRVVDFADGTRECTGCGSRLPLAQFDVDKSASLGRKSKCKACRSRQMRELYLRDPESKRAAVASYRAANPERVRKSEADRYARSREARIALAAEHGHRRRARLAELPYERGITRRSLRKVHGDHCCYCGVLMTFESRPRGEYVPDLATIEHIVPISRGGGHVWSNVTLACWECNIRRGNRGDIDGGEVRPDGTADLDEAAA